MAYVLGYFAADGSMIRNKRGAHFIEFTSTDKSLIILVQQALSSGHSISVRPARLPTHKISYRIQIGSKILFTDLTRLGFTQNKSCTLRFPAFLPAHLLGHFVRGYFDGDGSVYFHRHAVKDRKNKRWIFHSRFTSGSKSFLDSLHKLLLTHGIRGGFVLQKKGGHELVLSHKDSVALYRLMYNTVPDSGLYLIRKRNTFKDALQTLYEMRP